MDFNEKMPGKMKEQELWEAIKGKCCFSLGELKEKTGLDFTELFPMVGRLAMDGKVVLSVSVNAESNYVHQSRNEYLFARFMELVSTYLSVERSISFYASKLCISPKYLTSVVKQVSGKTPTTLIREKVMDEIKYKLCCTQSTIKEIAYGLNFPNLSFFGKYFKAETGVSPSVYRMMCVEKVKNR